MDRIPCLLPLFLLADLFSVLFVSSRFLYFVHFLHHRVYFLFFCVCFFSLSPFFCNRLCVLFVVHQFTLVLTGSGVNRSNSENENKNSSGQRNIYIHDEPPHFNLRFTAPDYNNTSQRIKRNNCWDCFFFLRCFLPGYNRTLLSRYAIFHSLFAAALANARLRWNP